MEVLRANAPSCGPWVKKFEEEFAAFCGTQYGLAVTSGTTGLHLAMVAADIRPGDEVITTPISWVATANAAAVLGAKIVFADVNPKTLNLDPASVEKKITPRTKAILPVHLYGQCATWTRSTNWRDPAKSLLSRMRRTPRAPNTKDGKPGRWATSPCSASTNRKIW